MSSRPKPIYSERDCPVCTRRASSFRHDPLYSFPHSMCKKVESLAAKTGCTLCTKRTISFEVSRFHTETRLLQRDFIFLNLFALETFCVYKLHHSKPHIQFSTLCDFICYFSYIYWLFWAIRPSNWKAFEMNSEKVESWHGIIISPT